MFVLGTRPEIIKLSPIIRRCESYEYSFSIVHTGQHYDDNLNRVFFEQLELPEPDTNLAVGSKPPGQQTGEMIAGIERELNRIDPDVVLVQGDTNSVLAGAVATCKHSANLGHVEAGLRSFDRNMPEEINRVLSDHAADYMFAPTEKSKELLLEEGLSESRIVVTGNTIVDAVQDIKHISDEKSDVLERLNISTDEYILATVHRTENVDNEERFRGIINGIQSFAEAISKLAIYPIHPRAAKQIDEFEIEIPETIRLIDPQDFLDFLKLERNAHIVFTDSGGVQEETCILGVPCVTVRNNTERPESVSVGANVLAGTDPETIVNKGKEMAQRKTNWENPYGDGTAAEQIISFINKNGV